MRRREEKNLIGFGERALNWLDLRAAKKGSSGPDAHNQVGGCFLGEKNNQSVWTETNTKN